MRVSGGCSKVGRVLLPSHSRTTQRLACTPSPCPHPADKKKQKENPQWFDKQNVVRQSEAFVLSLEARLCLICVCSQRQPL